jgi:hypothetical protein
MHYSKTKLRSDGDEPQMDWVHVLMAELHACLPDIINPMYIQQLREIILPPIRKTVGIYKQVINVILCF